MRHQENLGESSVCAGRLAGPESSRQQSIMGFTLIELMAVLAILSILSMAAVMSYQRYIRNARSMEAIHMLADIGVKQATYFSLYGQYVDTTTSPIKIDEGNSADFYPSTVGAGYQPWSIACPNTDAQLQGWCALGVTPSANRVRYQYATCGWGPNETGTPPTTRISDPTRKWWYAVARGDIDGNGQYSTFVFSSEVSEVYSFSPTQ